MYLILLVLLILIIVGAPVGPWWGPTPHSWGWYPSGGLGLVLLILLILVLLGRV